MATLKSGTTVSGYTAHHQGNHRHEVWLTMYSREFGTSSSNSWMAVNESYMLWTPANYVIWKQENQIGHKIYFEVVMAAQSGTQTVRARLWNVTDNAWLAEVAASATTDPKRIRSSVIPLPSSEKTLRVDVYNYTLYAARLILVPA